MRTSRFFRPVLDALICATLALPFASPLIPLAAQASSAPGDDGKCYGRPPGLAPGELADQVQVPCGTRTSYASNGALSPDQPTREPFVYSPQSQRSLAAAVAMERDAKGRKVDGDRTVLTLPASTLRDALNKILSTHFENNQDLALAIRSWQVGPCPRGEHHLARVVKKTDQVDFGLGWKRNPDPGERCLYDENGRAVLSLKCGNPYLDRVINSAYIRARARVEVATTLPVPDGRPVATPVAAVPARVDTVIVETEPAALPHTSVGPSWWVSNRKWVVPVSAAVLGGVTAYFVTRNGKEVTQCVYVNNAVVTCP